MRIPKKTKSVKTNNSSLLSKISGSKTFLIVAFVSMFAAIGVTSLFVANAAPKNRQQGVSISAESSSSRVSLGQNVVVTIVADAQSNIVNAIQANITYDTNDLEFISIDTSNSAFVIDVEAVNNNGVIKIARGNIVNLTGKMEVAKVIFKTINKTRRSNISFIDGTALIDSTSYLNILENTQDYKFSIR